MDALPEGTHLVFTDGACHGNPGPAGSGAVVNIAGGPTLEKSKALGIATNNVGELTAVGMALDLLEQGEVPKDATIALFTDSKYTMGVLAQGWKAKANRELILEIRGRLKDWPNLEINWVAGHVGVPENERADELATLGARQSG
ncbi:MAG: reverse transcriptase-like protein [Proteobacteria bacterium]|nr:reverse transcriptase-like protein [Pseudomonadota bacterium]MCP4920961.1 reverse transcriptase-like protein [Pseudomonadota bacterium]